MPAQVIHIPGSPQSHSRARSGRVALLLLTQVVALAVLVALYLSRNDTTLEPLHFLVTLGPRIAFVVPFLVLLPWALYEKHRWVVAEQLFLLVLVLGPLMGLHVRGLWVDREIKPNEEPNHVRVMSFNIGPYGLDIEKLVQYLNQNKVDILLIQEDTYLWKFAARLAQEKGWYANRTNTVFSRIPIIAQSEELPGEFGGPKIYAGHFDMVRVSNGKLDFLVGSAHAPSLRSGFHNLVDHMDLTELKNSTDWQKRQVERIAAMIDAGDDRPVIVGGDFNIPAGSIYSRPLDKRYIDAFAEVGSGYGYTFPTRFPWLRLDRFYTTRDWRPVRFQIVPEMGSDHHPVMADFVLRQIP